MIEIMQRAEQIRNYLELFDRELADHIKPLAMIIDGFDQKGDGKHIKDDKKHRAFNFVY